MGTTRPKIMTGDRQIMNTIKVRPAPQSVDMTRDLAIALYLTHLGHGAGVKEQKWTVDWAVEASVNFVEMTKNKLWPV